MKNLFIGLMLLTSVSTFASENEVLPILHVERWNNLENAYPELEAKCLEKGGVLISKLTEEAGRDSVYDSYGIAGACLVGKKSKGIYIPVTEVSNYTASADAPTRLQKKCSDLGGKLTSETLRELMGSKLDQPYVSAALCKL